MYASDAARDAAGSHETLTAAWSQMQYMQQGQQRSSGGHMGLSESAGSHVSMQDSRGSAQHVGSQASQFGGFHHHQAGHQGVSHSHSHSHSGVQSASSMLSAINANGMSGSNLAGISGNGLHGAASFAQFGQSSQLPLAPMNHSMNHGMGMYQQQSMLQDVQQSSMLQLMSNLEGQNAAFHY
jgi:hypothetical protein